MEKIHAYKQNIYSLQHLLPNQTRHVAHPEICLLAVTLHISWTALFHTIQYFLICEILYKSMFFHLSQLTSHTFSTLLHKSHSLSHSHSLKSCSLLTKSPPHHTHSLNHHTPLPLFSTPTHLLLNQTRYLFPTQSLLKIIMLRQLKTRFRN